jgi:hypothetical protein
MNHIYEKDSFLVSTKNKVLKFYTLLLILLKLIKDFLNTKILLLEIS